MAMHDSSREEVIDEPELNVDDYLYCKISSTSNYDDYLYKRAYTKLSPQKVLEELDDPELYSQLSNSVISFLKRSQKTSCENSSVSSGSDSDTSGHNVSNTSSPSTRERAKGSSSPRPVKKDSLLYLQLLKEDRERSNSSSSNINKREYERAIDFQQTLKRIPSPQYVVKKAADVNNITVPCTAEEFSSSIRQERKLLPSTVNNNYNISPQSIEEMPLKYTTKIVQPVKSVKNNVATATVDNVNNNNGFQKKHEDIVNIIVQNNNNNKQISNNNILLKTYKNVTLNFSKQYQNHSNTLNNKSDATNCHNEFNNNNIVNNNNNNYSNDNSNADVINSKKNSNDVLLMNQPPHSKILYRHLTNENNKFYNHSGKKCFIPLSNCRSNENLKDDNSHLELSAPPPPPTLPLSPATLQLYAATTGNVSNVICEKSNNFMIPKGTMLKTLVTTTTSPAKNILTREPLQQQQQQQQQQRALNIVSGDRNGNNYDSIITLSLENSNNNNNNNNQNNIDINRTNNSPNNNNNITGNFFDNNSNSSNSEIVIEVGDKSKLAVNNNGCCGNKEIVTSAVPLQQSLHYQQHQLVAPTMVCLKRGGDIGQPSPQHYNQQSPLFNRSHVTHIVERKLIPSNSSTNKYETTFIQKRSEQLVPIQTCRILDNKQVIKQYCGPKVKSEKRTFSVMEPIVISPSVPSDNGSPALSGSTIKGTDDMFKGVSNEQMSSLQRLLKLGTTATVMSNEEKKIKLETIVKKLWAKELCEPPLPPQSSSEN